MARHRFIFRTFAADQTDSWNLPDALKGATVFGLYFFLEGEATHICSFEASSRVEFLENVFVDPDDPEAADAELQSGDLTHENDGAWTEYFGFINTAAESNRLYIGPREVFTLDSRDYDLDADEYAGQLSKSLRFNVSPQQAHADARRTCLREFAYEAAREEFNANSPTEPPVCWGGKALAEHKARVAMAIARAEERERGVPPLFSSAGIAAPLATSPADLHR